MANISWLKALYEACLHAHDPQLHYQDRESIVKRFLWGWEEYPSPIAPPWEQFFDQGRVYERRSAQDIFPILQRALTEGEKEERVLALFLLGGLATSEARDLLISFLNSPHRKERWASAIALGRLKEERVFAVLHTLLLEGFATNEVFASVEERHIAREDGYLYQRALQEQGRAEHSENFWRLYEHLESIGYEWYLRQRSECALVLGDWGNPAAVPPLKEALQAAWRMEQVWPDYQGPDESGPDIWHFFQDRLAFALGQLGAWDILATLYLPEAHLLIARIYLILGSLQVRDPRVFYGDSASTLFHNTSLNVRSRAWEKKGIQAHSFATLFVDPVRVKPLLAEHFGLSPAEQEDALTRFPTAWYERTKES